MLYSTLVAAVALASAASALMITAPTNSSGWTNSGSQVIEWDSVSTDPSNFTIQLINPASPNAPVTIAENVETSANSYTYTPDSDLSAADQYRVNIVRENSDGGEQILAQSDYFEVEEGTSTVSASASASSSSSASSASQSASQTSGSPSSSASSAAASSSAPNAAGALAAPGGLLLLVAGAVGVLA